MIRFTDQITPEEYMGLRKKVGWVEFPIEEAEACVRNAYLVLCVRDDDQAVGVVRLLWDGGYVAFLSDLIVDPGYQGRGIGRELVETVIRRIREEMKPGYKVKLTLNSSRGKEPFYVKFGFRARPNEDAGAAVDQWLTADCS